MASTWSDLKFELIGTGDQSGTWGATTNDNLGIAIQQAIGGKADVTMSSTTITLTLTDTTALQNARALYLNLTGTPGGAATLNVPAVQKAYIVYNNTTGGFAVTVKVSGQTGVSVPNGKSMLLYDNGTDVVDAVTHLSSLTLGSALPIASGGTGTTTLTANNVILGNGTSAVQFVAPGSSGNVLTSNGTTWASSALPAGGLTYVYKTSNYTTQDKEGVLANTTGGAFTVTLPATPATGAQVVVADAGAYWGTNNLTVGRNGSTIGDLAQDLVCDITGASVQLVYDGTTWEVYAQIGGNGGNAATQPGNNSFTGANTFYNATGQTFAPASTNDGIIVLGRAGGSSSYRVTLAPTTLSASRTLTLPDASTTVVGTDATQTLTNKTLQAPNITSGLTLNGAAGTSGQVLTSAGSGSLPTWNDASGGAWIYLSTVTASNSATADIETTFDSTYDNYVIVACDVQVLTATAQLRCYPKLGGTYTAGADWGAHGSTAVFSSTASYIQTAVNGTGAYTQIIGSQNSSENNRRLEFVMEVMGPVSNTTVGKGIIYRGTYRDSNTTGYSFVGGSMFRTNNFDCAALTGIRFQASAGNISGTFRLYGIKNS